MDNTHQREQAIFDAALELPPEQRPAYVESASEGDAEIRERITELLQACGHTSDYLDDPPARRTFSGGVVAEEPGDIIGRYKLLQQIGEGGCGVVYMAEQAEPVRRRVALKIIKLGMDTKSVIARFEAERQALAMMDHPNIAKVFDAGATETGRPYFVMELVRGRKITDYCDEKNLSTRERLDLFIQVCRAIQHAHQKGIIHRDIKPSNILVSMDDGALVPKVIDFGIAKATGGAQLTDKTLFTAFEQFIGTPAYMSPEQAVLTNVDIDTRSDIYALGVLLYELLTGQTPFDAKELLATGLDAMRKTIQETEPPKPSTRLSTLPGRELSTLAQCRGLDAPKLVSELRGDLDWIVMKCLEKDRARRYETANGLAMDIQRHLDCEPVVACPPAKLYRLRKMAHRNRVAFVAGSAVAVSLLVGSIVSTVLFFRERAARQQVNEQVSVTRAVNTFLLHDLLGQASSEGQARMGFTPDPDLTVREALDRAAKRVGGRFQGRWREEAVVRFHLGGAFAGIGQPERGIPHLQRALELYQANLGSDHPLTLSAMNSLGAVYGSVGKLEQALPLLKEALEGMKARVGPEDRVTRLVANDLASAYRAAGELDKALLLEQETVRSFKTNEIPKDREALGAMNNLAMIYRDAGKPEQAVPLLEETLASMTAHLRPGDPWTLNAMANLADCYRRVGKLEQALPLLEKTVQLSKASIGPDHPQTLASLDALARAYHEEGGHEAALPVLEEKVNILKTRLGLRSSRTQDAMHELAMCYWDAGKLDQARSVLEDIVKLKKTTLGPANLDISVEMNNLAAILAETKNYRQAETVYRGALPYLRVASSNEPPSEAPLLGTVLHHLADVLRERNKSGDARSFAEEAIAEYERHPNWPIREQQHACEVLKAVLRDLGDNRGVETVRVRQMEALRAAAANDDVDALNNLAWILATSRDAAHRDGHSAVQFAEKAVAKAGRKNPGILDTLAAAYAEAGEFSKAAGVQREAVGLCQDDGSKASFTNRLKLYESNISYREP